jgi:hypothetical protein
MLLDMVYENGTYRTVEPFVPEPGMVLKLVVKETNSSLSGDSVLRPSSWGYYPLDDLPDEKDLDYQDSPGRDAGTMLVKFVDGGKGPTMHLPEELFE